MRSFLRVRHTAACDCQELVRRLPNGTAPERGTPLALFVRSRRLVAPTQASAACTRSELGGALRGTDATRVESEPLGEARGRQLAANVVADCVQGRRVGGQTSPTGRDRHPAA